MHSVNFVDVFVVIVATIALCYLLFGSFKRVGIFHILTLSFLSIQIVGLPAVGAVRGSDFFLLQVLALPVVLIAGRLAYFRALPKPKGQMAQIDYASSFYYSHAYKIMLFVLLLPVVYIFDKGFSGVSLFHSILNPGDRIGSMNRRLSGYDSNIHWSLGAIYAYSKTLLIPLVAASSYVGMRLNLIDKKLAIMTIVSSMFFLILSLEKAPIAFIATILILAHLYSGGKLNVRLLVFGFLLIVVLPASVYPLLAYGTFEGGVVNYMVDNFVVRFFEVSPRMSKFYVDNVEDIIGFSGWSSNRWLAEIAGVEFVNRPRALADRFFANNYVRSGSMPAGFHASFFADWGMSGAFVALAIAGGVLGRIQRLLDDRFYNPLGIAAQAVLVWAVTTLSISDFYSVSLGRGLVALPLLLLLSDMVLRNLYVTRKRRVRSPAYEIAS